MFFLLDAKITILYLFSMQNWWKACINRYNGKISKKNHSECRKKTENELISCNIQNDKS